MKVPDRNLQELREQGFTIVEAFLAPDELKAAQEALWLHYPRPEEYFADASAHQDYARSQFDGIRTGPWQSWDLNRLAFHPDLVDLAERFLGSADLHLYNAEAVRLPGDRRHLLERPDAQRRAVSLPEDGHDALLGWRSRVGPSPRRRPTRRHIDVGHRREAPLGDYRVIDQHGACCACHAILTSSIE